MPTRSLHRDFIANVPFSDAKSVFWRTLSRHSGFIHSVLSFTRLEVPALEYFETAVAFSPDTDPITAHKELADVFGRKAGEGEFLFRADSSIAGRYWVQSAAPWNRWPATAVSALESKRIVVQVAQGLMYRFTLQVCAGRIRASGDRKAIEPYTSGDEVESWLRANAAKYGFTPLMLDVSMQALRFSHAGQKIKIDFAQVDGALEVAEPELFKNRVALGFGHHRRAGLGLMQLMA